MPKYYGRRLLLLIEAIFNRLHRMQAANAPFGFKNLSLSNENSSLMSTLAPVPCFKMKSRKQPVSNVNTF